MDDLLDVVDENDYVIGQEYFTPCHEKNLLHRASCVFVFKNNSFQELLITRRGPGVRSPEKLDCPGGHLKSGQTYLEGAKRELQEEIFHKQILPTDISFEELFNIKIDGDGDSSFVTLFRISYPGPFSNCPKETEDSFFMKIDDLFKDIKDNSDKYTEGFITLLEEYKKRLLYHENI